LARVLPGADPRALAPLVHLEESLPPRWQRRLAVLGGDLGDLRLSRQEQAEISRIRDEIGSGAAPAVLGWKLGEVPGQDVVLARAAVLEQPLPPDWHGEVTRGAQSVFPVSAQDLMPSLQGPALGERLRLLEKRWLDSGLRLDRTALLQGGDDRGVTSP